MARKKLGEMLVEAGVLAEQGLRMALAEQRRWGGALGRLLVDLKLVSEPELVGALSEQLNVEIVDLDALDIHPSVLALVPADVAEQHALIPFAQPMKFLDVAMSDPTNLGIIDELRIRTQLNIRPYLAGPKMIERALGKFYNRGFARHRARSQTAQMPNIETGDTLMPTASGSAFRRVDGDDIDAARRREGLPPRGKPGATRPAAHDFGAHAPAPRSRDAEIDALQDRISRLEALVERDEDVLRKLLALLVEKGVASRDEILERIR